MKVMMTHGSTGTSKRWQASQKRHRAPRDTAGPTSKPASIQTTQQIVCFDSVDAAKVYTDEDKPVPNSLIEGWRYTRGTSGDPRSKINWYMITPDFPPTLVGPSFPFAELESVFAGESKVASLQYSSHSFHTSPHCDLSPVNPVITLEQPPFFGSPYFAMYFGPFGNRIQWRVPEIPGLYPITGKVLLWAGPIAPPADFHPGVSARLLRSCSQWRCQCQRWRISTNHCRPSHLYLVWHRQ